MPWKASIPSPSSCDPPAFSLISLRLVATVFFNHDAALRFVRDESSDHPVPKRDATLDGNVAVTQVRAPLAFNVQRAAILAQLAFVGFLLMGRVAAGIVDASVMPAFDSVIVSGSPQAGLME